VITVETMRDRLLPLDQVRSTLETTEPMTEVAFPVGDGVSFEFGGDWLALTAQEHEETSGAVARVGGQEFSLTRSAALEVTSACGIPKGYASRTPGNLLQDHVNYWFQGGFGTKEFKLLVRDGTEGMAVVRSSIVPFSNLRILDEVEAGIKAQYGSDTEILADYKLSHDLSGTWVRLVLPGVVKTLQGTGTDNDEWSVGVQFRNSQIGTGPTSIEGYLFRWWCTNGAIDQGQHSGVWSRRSGDQNEVYEWARSAVDGVLGGLEPALDMVGALTQVPVANEAVAVLRDMFSFYSVPAPIRNRVTELMVEATELTMYEVMAAVTQAANDEDIPPKHVDQLLRVGGDIPHRISARCDSCHRIQS
jgi:hypothetical protein